MYRRISPVILLAGLGIAHIKASGQYSSLVSLAALILLLLTIRLTERSAHETDKAMIRPGNWFGPFLITLGLSAALVLYTNPDGRFPWNQRERYIGLPTRSIKPQLYRKLIHTPDAILFGSSVSFTMPANYYRGKWGLDAFNMSISGGAPNDYFHLLNYLIKAAPDGRTPSLVTIELLWSDLRPSRNPPMPWSLVPYMEVQQGSAAVLDMLDSPLQLNPVLDAILTALYINSPNRRYDLDFTADGTGLRMREELTPAEYQQNMMNEVALQKRVMSCRQLNPAGVAYMEKIAAMSQEHHFAIVFYRPPVNGDFYSIAGVKPRRFESCTRLVDAYMEELAGRHPNIFYTDLVQYEPIASLGAQVYIDPRHLTREGNTMLLQALEPDIERALEWAKENR